MDEIAQKARILRLGRNMTIAEAAKLGGFSSRTIIRLETQGKIPRRIDAYIDALRDSEVAPQRPTRKNPKIRKGKTPA